MEHDWQKAIHDSNLEKMESVKETILDGGIYARIESVSGSGMSRRILFYRIHDGNIENVTAVVGWLTGWLKMDQFMQGGKHVSENGLRVGGCGMDMIFHSLYTALPYELAKDWNQRYRML